MDSLQNTRKSGKNMKSTTRFDWRMLFDIYFSDKCVFFFFISQAVKPRYENALLTMTLRRLDEDGRATYSFCRLLKPYS